LHYRVFVASKPIAVLTQINCKGMYHESFSTS
jgi:hypothetical protein